MTQLSSAERKKQVLSAADNLLETNGEPVAAEVRDLAARRRELRADLKRLRGEKQSVAAEFKTCSDAAAKNELKRRMTQAVASLTEAEEALRAVELELLEKLDAEAQPDAHAGARFPRHLVPGVPSGDDDGPLQIEELHAGNRGDWDRFVGAHERASLYHDARWLDIVERTMRQQSLSLLARGGDGNVAAVLPLCRLKSALFGDFAVSMPYVNSGGALGVSARVEDALMREASERAARIGLRHVEFRGVTPRAGWPNRTDKVSMIRRLPTTHAELDAELGAKVRSQIKRAERENVEVLQDESAARLQDFYAVFARNMRDLGTPVYSRALFEAILAAWPGDATLLCVRLGGVPVAGAFLIRHRDTMEIPWASTLRETNSLGINMLMYRAALGFAIDRGCRYFDFGRSTRGSGTYRFKEQWGAVPAEHHWHYWLPAGREVPRLNPDNPRYRAAIAAWQRLPVAVTRWLGPHIVRNLP